MRKLAWLLVILPVVVVADDINITSSDGLTKTVSVATPGPTGATGPAGPAGPAFTGGTLTSAVLGVAADNCADPPYSFDGDATSGFCSSAAGTLNFYTAATNRLALTNTAATFSTPILASNGSATTPGYSFSSATGDGIYWLAGGTGGTYIQSAGPYLNLRLDPGLDDAQPTSSLTFHTTTGTQLINMTTVTQYASLLLAGATPSNLLRAHNGSDDNQITQTATSTDFTDRVILGGLPALSGCTTKALTDAAAAVTFARVAVATNSYMATEFDWTATSTDGTDQIVTFGRQPVVGVDKAGTVTCATSAAFATTTASTNANTLVCTVTTVTSTTNCDAQVTCTNNTAGVQTLNFCWRAQQHSYNAVSVP